MNHIFRLKKHKPKTEIIAHTPNDVNTAIGKTITTANTNGSAKLILDNVRWEASIYIYY